MLVTGDVAAGAFHFDAAFGQDFIDVGRDPAVLLAFFGHRLDAVTAERIAFNDAAVHHAGEDDLGPVVVLVVALFASGPAANLLGADEIAAPGFEVMKNVAFVSIHDFRIVPENCEGVEPLAGAEIFQLRGCTSGTAGPRGCGTVSYERSSSVPRQRSAKGMTTLKFLCI